MRGAYNCLSQLTEAQHRRGVVACSSGNHAQGVAASAQQLGIPATIIMPSDAPVVKRDATRSYGANVIDYDRRKDNREHMALDFAKENCAVFVPPYDDIDVMAGQATVGLELFDQAHAAGKTLDIVLVCCGGGGLLAGISSALAQLSPATQVFSVEPEGYDDHARSWRSGRRERNAWLPHSICDAILTPQPGVITFDINKNLVAGGCVVTDAAVVAAMRFAFESLKMVLEPSGAVALAALMSGAIECKGACVGITLSGGNVDKQVFKETLIN